MFGFKIVEEDEYEGLKIAFGFKESQVKSLKQDVTKLQEKLLGKSIIIKNEMDENLRLQKDLKDEMHRSEKLQKDFLKIIDKNATLETNIEQRDILIKDLQENTLLHKVSEEQLRKIIVSTHHGIYKKDLSPISALNFAKDKVLNVKKKDAKKDAKKC